MNTSAASIIEPERLSSSTDASKKSARLVSIDALRGFDMLCILGSTEVVVSIAKIFPKPAMQEIADQLEHKPWRGFAFEDLLFPMFVFVVGVSLVFSLGKLIQTRGKLIAVRRIVLRSIALFLLGVLYNTGIGKHYSDIRIMGVLQRIALAYLAAGLMFCFLGRKSMVAVAVGILLAYWALLAFVPVPDVGNHGFAEGRNWPNYVDVRFLPLHKYDGDHDPEGLLSTFPAIATCLLGVFAGMLVKSGSVRPYAKVAWLVIGGALGVFAGYAWGLELPFIHNLGGMEFPVVKKLWTSSYVLVAGGYSAALFGLFYMAIDVWKLQRWATPFVWVGMNAITLYMVQRLFGFKPLAQRCIGGDFSHDVLGRFGPLAIEILALAFLLIFARFLYKRQVFLRV